MQKTLLAPIFALVLAASACGESTPPAKSPEGGGTAEAAPFGCDEMCRKANTVPGCIQDANNIKPCAEVCNANKEKCKAQTDAALACMKTATLKCKDDKGVDESECATSLKSWEDCTK